MWQFFTKTMAGRKDKNTVDYFPHFCASGKTIYILESKYSNDGYATWFKTLELLGSTENHFIDCRDASTWEFMLAKMRLSDEKLNEIYTTLANLDAINKTLWENRVIWSENFIRNLTDVYARRKTNLMEFEDLCEHLSILCEHKFDSTGNDVDKNTQSKVKESKVKESKVLLGENCPYDDIKSLYNSICKSLPKIAKLSDSRKEKIRLRWKEMEQNIGTVQTVFEKAENSNFCKGENDRGWTASFDWIFENDKNWLKIYEGKYANKSKSGGVNDIWEQQ